MAARCNFIFRVIVIWVSPTPNYFCNQKKETFPWKLGVVERKLARAAESIIESPFSLLKTLVLELYSTYLFAPTATIEWSVKSVAHEVPHEPKKSWSGEARLSLFSRDFLCLPGPRNFVWCQAFFSSSFSTSPQPGSFDLFLLISGRGTLFQSSSLLCPRGKFYVPGKSRIMEYYMTPGNFIPDGLTFQFRGFGRITSTRPATTWKTFSPPAT